MIIDLFINGKKIQAETAPDQMLIDFLRGLGYKSMKRGCDTGNCGLCTVWMDEKPVLSCSVPAARAAGHKITTLEGVQEEAAEFSDYLANEGADQCGYCSPGLIMNVLALKREIPNPTMAQIKEYLSGNFMQMHRISGTVPRPCKIFWSGGVVRKMENTRFVNKGIVKKDAKALLSGRPVYTDDIAPSGCLVVKLLRSPHAHAWIENIQQQRH